MKPFISYIPQVQKPGRSVPFQERLVWTLFALLIYLVSSHIPLFGILTSNIKDPLYWMRMMMASNRGTLMDLGISPIVTSGMFLQMLTSLDLVKVNYSVKEDQILYDGAQKFIALLLTLGQAITQVCAGFYGPRAHLGLWNSILLVIQLLFSGIIIILLDELLQNGYGLGSGINLFIATNVCETIIWRSLSPKAFKTARGVEFEGCLVALLHTLITRKNKWAGLKEVFFRKNLPNLSCLVTTLIIFAIVIYLHGLRLELPTESLQVKGQTGKFPIKLLYASTMPVILQGYVISNITMISKFLYHRFSNIFLVRLFGVWGINEYGHEVPLSGICYILYPPESISEAMSKPFCFAIHVTFMLLSCAFFSRAWIDVTDNNQVTIAKQLRNQRMTIRGVSEQNLSNYLAKYIPTAAFLGGFFIGLVCMLAGLFDTIGSGSNIILTVSIIWKYIELFTKETMKMSGVRFIE
ncbi:Protein transport protein Sec61 subunit alpha [Dictyocoela muelleri]|nr:Protein transport protein Sec61 subunit alpha [Dictyocoela muelleri]